MSMRKILRVMQFAHDNPAQYSEDEIRKRFTPREYDMFSQFCLGGPIPFAEYHQHRLRLTSYGVREYHHLLGHEAQRRFNRSLLVAVWILALAFLYPIVLDLASLWVF